jgi:hypothetical protein
MCERDGGKNFPSQTHDGRFLQTESEAQPDIIAQHLNVISAVQLMMRAKYLSGSIRNLTRRIPGNGDEAGKIDEANGRQGQLTGMPRTF